MKILWEKRGYSTYSPVNGFQGDESWSNENKNDRRHDETDDEDVERFFVENVGEGGNLVVECVYQLDAVGFLGVFGHFVAGFLQRDKSALLSQSVSCNKRQGIV